MTTGQPQSAVLRDALHQEQATLADRLPALAWAAPRFGEALEALARRRGLLARPYEAPALPATLHAADAARIGTWLDQAAAHMSLEVEATSTTYDDLSRFVRGASPALLLLPQRTPDGNLQALALLRGGLRRVTLLDSDLRPVRVPAAELAALLGAPLEAPLVAGIDATLAAANVPAERLEQARGAMLRQRLAGTPLRGGWLVRLAPGAASWLHIRHANLHTAVSGYVLLYLLRQGLELLSWVLIGYGALNGRFDWAWLWAWALLMLTILPLQLFESYSENEFATRAGALFKLRLLAGTLRLHPDEVRSQGAGQFLGRTIDAEVVETLGIDGGFRFIVGMLRVGVTLFVLAAGVGGGLHAGLFALTVLLALLAGWRLYRRSRDWLTAHRDMTNDLVERMVGHRTRIAQENPAVWHADEDRALAQYLKLSQRVDATTGQMQATLERGWLVLGLTGLVPPLVLGNVSLPGLAVAVGGMLLGMQALENLSQGTRSVTTLAIVWEQVAPLYRAASRPARLPPTDGVVVPPPADSAAPAPATQADAPARDGTPARDGEAQPLLVARDLRFTYATRPQPVLHGASLAVYPGDRILLEGPSGGGKSTLAALLTGLQQADAGLLLLWGYDRSTLGDATWRQRVVMAPQFHENHVLTGTFAFNLLMGRQWPPTPADLAAAETICVELGLGGLLERMPAGLQQMVGEGGWQLSHGERSRLFLARALLQRADLLILDESFAALDPETMQQALTTVLRRAPALVVIAHP